MVSSESVSSDIFGKYKNGNYKTYVNMNGTIARVHEFPSNTNIFYPKKPELINIDISTKCTVGCPFCYKNINNKFGKHANLLSGNKWISNLHWYTIVSISINDFTHPELMRFLFKLKSRKAFINLNMDQSIFNKNISLLEFLYTHGTINSIGVSMSPSYNISKEFIKNLKKFPTACVHIILGITTPEQISKLKDNHFKAYILGYKSISKGKSYYINHKEDILSNIKYVKSDMKKICGKWFEVLGIDNQALDILKVKDESEFRDMNDKFSFYMDLVEGKFAPDFLSKDKYSINDLSADDMFKHCTKIRKERRNS